MYKELPHALISGEESDSESELEVYKAASSSSELEFSIFMFGWILDFSVISKLFTKFI
ncbi:hypothetical protein CsSME_00045801 [Camellia sinensis var. sinensis]